MPSTTEEHRDHGEHQERAGDRGLGGLRRVGDRGAHQAALEIHDVTGTLDAPKGDAEHEAEDEADEALLQDHAHQHQHVRLAESVHLIDDIGDQRESDRDRHAASENTGDAGAHEDRDDDEHARHARHPDRHGDQEGMAEGDQLGEGFLEQKHLAFLVSQPAHLARHLYLHRAGGASRING